MMTISVNDQRLLEGKKNAFDRLSDLQFETQEAETLRKVAGAVLKESLDEYRKAIRREDLTAELRDVIQEPRRKAGDALVRVYYTLKRQYADRRAAGEPLTERDKQVEQFLHRLSPADYMTASFPSAVSALETAVDFANQNLPEDVQNFSNRALERAQETRERIEEFGERALQAYSDLESAREEAKSNYLAVRETISAALRLEDRYDDLNDYVPPVSEIMSPK